MRPSIVFSLGVRKSNFGGAKEKSRRVTGALWKPEEDKILLDHVARHGTNKWRLIKSMGLLPSRNHKSCCNRFIVLKRKLSRLQQTTHVDLADFDTSHQLCQRTAHKDLPDRGMTQNLHQRTAHKDMPDCGMSQNLHHHMAHTDLDRKATMPDKSMRAIAIQKFSGSNHLLTTSSCQQQRMSCQQQRMSCQHQYTPASDGMMPTDPKVEAATTVTSRLIMGDEAATAVAASVEMLGTTSPVAMVFPFPCSLEHQCRPTPRLCRSASQELQPSQKLLPSSQQPLPSPFLPSLQQFLPTSLLPSSPSQSLLYTMSIPSASPLVAPTAALPLPPSPTLPCPLPHPLPISQNEIEIHIPPTAALPPPPSTTLPFPLLPPLPPPLKEIDIGAFSLVDSPMQELQEIEAFLLGEMPPQQNSAFDSLSICARLQAEADQMPLAAASVDATKRLVCTDVIDTCPCLPAEDVAPDAVISAFAELPSPGAVCPGSAYPRGADAVSDGASRRLEAVLPGVADPCCNADMDFLRAGSDSVAAAAAPAAAAGAVAAIAAADASDAATAEDALAALAADNAIVCCLIEAELRRINDTLPLFTPQSQPAPKTSSESSPRFSPASALEEQISIETSQKMLLSSSLHPPSRAHPSNLASTVLSTVANFTSLPEASPSEISSWLPPPLPSATATSAAAFAADPAAVSSTPAATVVPHPLSRIFLPKKRPNEAV
ncbi:hypothetical protein CLOM_g4380 [Closterium sp. NIES-68]|nr:hypothetical protein CLOM_g4380 [Closterium sp. NIES-68]GJP86938.1 hypothetical protein CLOP_g16902 [Closterium sp. NIES-67]